MEKDLCFSGSRNAICHAANGCDFIPWYYHGLRERSFQDRRHETDPEGVAFSAHVVTMGREGKYPRKPVVANLRDTTPFATQRMGETHSWYQHGLRE